MDREKLQRDIDTLKESIALAKMNLHELDAAEVRAVLGHITILMRELEPLQNALKEIEKHGTAALPKKKSN